MITLQSQHYHSITGIGDRSSEIYLQNASWDWGAGAWGGLFGAQRVRRRVAPAVVKNVSVYCRGGVDIGVRSWTA